MKFYLTLTLILGISQALHQKPFHDVSILKSKLDKQQSLNSLREYLSLNTAHPNPDYSSSVVFLEKFSKDNGLKFYQFKCQPSNTPSVVLTWKGRNPNLPSIVLNSHYDVVPVVEEHWNYPPFNATLTKDAYGKDSVYARGAQDTKSLGIMYLEAIRNLIQQFPNGPLRNVHILFVPDEEVGGELGMKCFSKSDEWYKVIGEIGLLLDEGFLTDDDKVWAFYGERVQRGFKVTARGNSGHASYFISDLATDKMEAFNHKLRLFRYQEERRMKKHHLTLGEVTTVNLDIIKAGTAINVVPDKVEAWIDIRATPLTDLNKLKLKFERWAKESNVTIEALRSDEPHFTELKGNPFWYALKSKAKEFGLPLTPGIFPAATDSRHLRGKGIAAIGLTPINHHPIFVHANDEYIRLDSFYKGIQFYIHCLPSLFELA